MPIRLTILIAAGSALAGCSWAPPVQESRTGQIITAPANPSGVQRGPHGETSPVLLTARKMIGVDYAYGGHSPDTGFDCSGLVYYAHKVNGIQVPRTAAAQFRFADPVPRDALRPGDLMFFRTSGRKISHVGIYLGPGRFLHAPGTGKHVTVADHRSTYWRARFAGAGRVKTNYPLRTSAVRNPR